MTHRWNWWIWGGTLLVIVGALTYLPVFVLIPATRDFPWVNLLLLVAGLAFILLGVRRAFRDPEVYRGKVFGTVLATVSGLLLALFLFGMFYIMRQLPASADALKVGQQAPDFTLPDQDGKPVALAQLLASEQGQPIGRNPHAVLLIFYRGYW